MATVTTGKVRQIRGGEFLMGSEAAYPEERPVRRVAVEPFAIDRCPVTNADFTRFIEATGYVTVAERPIDPAQYPGAIPELCVPGSLVFARTAGPVDLRDWSQWWQWTPEAEWEYAARGGLQGKLFIWGDDMVPDGQIMANTWQGEFPWQNLLLDGYERTSPVASFPPNGYGLYDMAGNVWEWTSDWYSAIP